MQAAHERTQRKRAREESKACKGKADEDAKKSEREREREPRVSTTDPEARVMKMEADGGFAVLRTHPQRLRPWATADTRLIVGAVEGGQRGHRQRADAADGLMQIQQRTGKRPAQQLVDGGYTKHRGHRRGRSARHPGLCAGAGGREGWASTLLRAKARGHQPHRGLARAYEHRRGLRQICCWARAIAGVRACRTSRELKARARTTSGAWQRTAVRAGRAADGAHVYNVGAGSCSAAGRLARGVQRPRLDRAAQAPTPGRGHAGCPAGATIPSATHPRRPVRKLRQHAAQESQPRLGCAASARSSSSSSRVGCALRAVDPAPCAGTSGRVRPSGCRPGAWCAGTSGRHEPLEQREPGTLALLGVELASEEVARASPRSRTPVRSRSCPRRRSDPAEAPPRSWCGSRRAEIVLPSFRQEALPAPTAPPSRIPTCGTLSELRGARVLRRRPVRCLRGGRPCSSSRPRPALPGDSSLEAKRIPPCRSPRGTAPGTGARRPRGRARPRPADRRGRARSRGRRLAPARPGDRPPARARALRSPRRRRRARARPRAGRALRFGRLPSSRRRK